MENGEKSVPKIYKCEACDVRFKSVSPFQKHRILKHTRNCPVNESLLSPQDKLLKKQGSRKEYKCGICLKLYTVLDELLNHLDGHRTLKEKDMHFMNLVASRAGTPSKNSKKVKNNNSNVCRNSAANEGADSVNDLAQKESKSVLDAEKRKNSIAKHDVMKDVHAVDITSTKVGQTKAKHQEIKKTNLTRIKDTKKTKDVKKSSSLHVKNLRVIKRKRPIIKKKLDGEKQLVGFVSKNESTKSLSATTNDAKCSRTVKDKIPATDGNKVTWPYDSSKTKQCQFCKKLYSTVHRLKEHVRVAHRRDAESMCDVCFKVFSTPFNLRRHCTVHLTNKPFPCSVCWRQFKLQEEKEQHESTFHGIVYPTE